jgi:hypothetical protein
MLIMHGSHCSPARVFPSKPGSLDSRDDSYRIEQLLNVAFAVEDRDNAEASYRFDRRSGMKERTRSEAPYVQ